MQESCFNRLFLRHYFFPYGLDVVVLQTLILGGLLSLDMKKVSCCNSVRF